MNKTIQMLVEAINMIPRQFYTSVGDENSSGLIYDRLVSQLTVRYRKITGSYCKTEVYLPSSEIIQKFASTPEKKILVRKLNAGISSNSDLKSTLLMEQNINLSSSQKAMIILNTDCKLRRGIFYWEFFILHFLAEQKRNSIGAYIIINQEITSIKKKIDAYYKLGLYNSLSADNIFFLIKKNYASDITILNYKGEIIVSSIK